MVKAWIDAVREWMTYDVNPQARPRTNMKRLTLLTILLALSACEATTDKTDAKQSGATVSDTAQMGLVRYGS